MKRTYTELMAIPDFMDRYRYLRIGGGIGESTFGFDRWINQKFYNLSEWRSIRRSVILRDNGLDLSSEDHPIIGLIIIHHMNPITPEMIKRKDPSLIDPEFLISCSDNTHKAIHYGDIHLLENEIVIERKPFDTCPWR